MRKDRSGWARIAGFVNTLTIAGSSEGKTTIHNRLILHVLNAIVDAKEEALKENNLNYDVNLAMGANKQINRNKHVQS